MRTFTLFLVLSAFSFQLSVMPLHAAEAKSDSIGHGWLYSGWVTSGSRAGWHGNADSYIGFTLMGRPGYSLQLRATTAGSYEQLRDLTDVAIMVGKRFDPSHSAIVLASLGPALVRHRNHDYYYPDYYYSDNRTRTTGGLAGQLELVMPLMIRYGGLGISLYGNANPDVSYAALAITLHVGYIR